MRGDTLHGGKYIKGEKYTSALRFYYSGAGGFGGGGKEEHYLKIGSEEEEMGEERSRGETERERRGGKEEGSV